MKYHFKVHKSGNGFWAECIELEGCSSQGQNWDKLLKNVKEALNLYLSEPEHSGIVFPNPEKRLKGRNIVEIEVEPSVASATLIRQLRVKMHLSQHKMREALGMNH